MLEKYDAPLTEAHTPLYNKVAIQTLGQGDARAVVSTTRHPHREPPALRQYRSIKIGLCASQLGLQG